MSDALSLGTLLPAYDVGGELGRGAFGVVWSGFHRALERPVAIKALDPRLVAGDPSVKERFLSEARLSASLDHPNIVRVFDFVVGEHELVLVMELLGGGSLRERLAEGLLDQREACLVGVAIAAGLSHAHRRGIVHRDLKPANIMFTTEGVPKLVDFGVAKVLEATYALTATGGMVGTPAFMAPEQVLSEQVGPATDVYSAGVLLYLLLAGVLPFHSAESVVALALQHVTKPPPPLDERVPAALRHVVERCLEKAPGDRYSSAEELGQALLDAIADLSDETLHLDATHVLAPTSVLRPPSTEPARTARQHDVSGQETGQIDGARRPTSRSAAGAPRGPNGAPSMVIDTNRHYTVTIVTTKGDIVLDLDPALAPNTVNNFVVNASEGFYDGLTFHRVVPGFVIQGGDPEGTGRGGPGYRFADEPVRGEYTLGAVAMANAGPDTNGSQFFICIDDCRRSLDPLYNLFGYVVSGIEVALAIEVGDVMEEVTVAP